MSSIPLALRVPRSPAVFIGRGDELDLIASRIGEGGVVALAGLGGFGKTALACRAVEIMGLEATALFVSLVPGAGASLEIARACARLGGYRVTDWQLAATEPAAMLDSALEIAEREAATIVVDDLHVAPDALSVFARLCRVTRYARWIVTTRRAPDARGTEDNVIPLGPLTEAEVATLARACSPRLAPEDTRVLVSHAHGSPWRARRLARRVSADQDPATSVEGAAREALAALFAVQATLPRALLQSIAGCTHEDVDALMAQGLVEESAAGLSLHDLARELYASQHPAADQNLVARIAERLDDATDLDLAVEALRLWVRAGAFERARRLAARCLDGWIESGRAARVGAIAASAGHALAGARLACAVAHRTPGELTWALGLTRPSDIRSLLAWSELLLACGRFEESVDAARSLGSDARVEDRAAGALLAAEGLRQAGRSREALEVLESAPTTTGDLDALLVARRARLLAIVGDVDGAFAEHRLLDEIIVDSPRIRVEVQLTRQALLALLGRTKEARELGSRLEEDLDLAPFLGADALSRRCTEAVNAGELSVARDLLRRVGMEPSDDETDDEPSGDRLANRVVDEAPATLRMRTNELLFRFGFGAFGRAPERLTSLVDVAERSGNGEMLGWARCAAAYLQILRGESTPIPWPSTIADPGGPARSMYVTYCRIAARRAGRPIPAPERVVDAVDVLIAQARDRAEEAQLAGHFDDARQILAEGIALARLHGFALLEADLLMVAADLALADTSRVDNARARHLAAELDACARRMGSPRAALEAEVVAALAGSAPPSPAQRASWREMSAISPVARRRADALDGKPGADLVDRLVIAGCNELWSRTDAPTAEPPPSSSTGPKLAWRFDPVRRIARLHDRRVDLRSRTLFVKLLTRLVAAGDAGETKAALAQHVWGVRDYHPLRDDKRMHVAVRRLRVLLEEDSERPERVVTTDRGYAVRHHAM